MLMDWEHICIELDGSLHDDFIVKVRFNIRSSDLNLFFKSTKIITNRTIIEAGSLQRLLRVMHESYDLCD